MNLTLFVPLINKAYIIQWKKWLFTSWLYLQQIYYDYPQFNNNWLNHKTKTFYMAYVNKHHWSGLTKIAGQPQKLTSTLLHDLSQILCLAIYLSVWFFTKRSSSPGLSPCQGTTPYSHSASLHPGIEMGTDDINAGGKPAMDKHPTKGGVETLKVASCNGNQRWVPAWWATWLV